MDLLAAISLEESTAPPRLNSFADIVRDQAVAQPHNIALMFEGRKTTYRQLDRAGSQVAHGLRAVDPAIGVRIATLDKNSDRFYEILLGATKAGHVLVPINYRLAPREIAAIVNDAGATTLFVGPEHVAMIEKLLPELPTVRKVIALGSHHPAWENYEIWRDSQAADDPLLRFEPDAIAFQIYTSGTTGRPKGVQLTHTNWLTVVAGAKEWSPATPGDVGLVCGPQYHLTGIAQGCLGLAAGCRSIIVRDVIPSEILWLIQRERVTIAAFVPAVLRLLLQTPDCRETDFSSLRLIRYSASPIPLELLREAIGTFRCDFYQVYGLTETTGVITCLPPADHDPRGTPRMRSCGRPIAAAEVKVVDDAGHELPTSQVGEIICRSRQNMKGYWNLPNETAKTIRDGWLYSGDAGYFDADGYLFIYDRVKDMIVSGGENVYPAEVENALFGHSDVADVGVIGVPDERWGEAVKAIVVRQPGGDVTAEELIAYARQRVARYKVPKSIDFVESLPRNASGKILKRELRAPYWQSRERQVN
jgi:acyl-CoA synthetase (AMP-forming)/AMP-acid ligase II